MYELGRLTLLTPGSTGPLHDTSAGAVLFLQFREQTSCSLGDHLAASELHNPTFLCQTHLLDNLLFFPKGEGMHWGKGSGAECAMLSFPRKVMSGEHMVLSIIQRIQGVII